MNRRIYEESGYCPHIKDEVTVNVHVLVMKCLGGEGERYNGIDCPVNTFGCQNCSFVDANKYDRQIR